MESLHRFLFSPKLTTLLAFCAAMATTSSEAFSQTDKRIADLRDFRDQELRSAGFTLSREAEVHISAIGGGEKKRFENWFDDDEPQLYAGGWIIDADTRDVVWEMDFDNTSGREGRRTFEGDITLPKGSYEVYFVAYAFHQREGFSSFSINIDRRGERPHRRSFGGKLLSFLGIDDEGRYEDFMELAKSWGIAVTVSDESALAVTRFDPPLHKEKPLFSTENIGDEEVIRKTLKLSKDVVFNVRAIGEGRKNDGMFDYGWIVNSDSRERVWEITLKNTKHAGGAPKNRLYDGEVALSKGTYELVYITDGSHSPEDWNAKPPYDPYHYGLTVFAKNEADKKAVAISDFVDDEKNVIVKLTKVRDKDFVSAGFTLKKDTKLRVYALGEIDSEGESADYGWIVNTKTHERVWRMDRLETVHAGGDQKNRMADDIITLPQGSYMAYYQTDDSHAYHEWNSDAPFDEEHWGLTVYGFGESFDQKSVTAFKEEEEENVIAQIIKVRDGRHETKTFRVEKPTSVRVYAIGEAMDKEMYDYGWIEESESGRTVWEMTYRMTEHAGGARKNRMVSTMITLKPGEYELHYETDGSHSFGDWNDDPPEDRTHWGITVYKER